MIDESYAAIAALGYSPVESTDYNNVTFMVEYLGMEPAAEWTPSVTEKYEISVWIEEMNSSQEMQSLLEATMRKVYMTLVSLFSTNIESAQLMRSSRMENRNESPNFRLIISTAAPENEWGQLGLL